MQKALGWFLRHVHVQSYMLLKQCLKEFQIESGNILYFQRDFFFLISSGVKRSFAPARIEIIELPLFSFERQ